MRTLLLLSVLLLWYRATLSAERDKGDAADVTKYGVFTPKPDYPAEAEANRWTGNGIVVVEVDPDTGRVTSATIVKSTGHTILDESALRAFREWRFRPGTPAKIKIPVAFTSPKTQRGGGRALAIYAPAPEYPFEARKRGAMGKGVAVLEVDPRTGNVISGRMSPSTHNKILDDAALEAFRHWRFKVGTVSRVKIPIKFTMYGVRF